MQGQGHSELLGRRHHARQKFGEMLPQDFGVMSR